MLKAVLFDFNGIIINDEPLHQALIEELLLGENLRPCEAEFEQLCLGRSDRVCLREILAKRGRMVSDDYLNQLVAKKSQAYIQRIEQTENLPIYPGIKGFLRNLEERGLKIALVTGALRAEVELILRRIGIADHFSVLVSGEDIEGSKPQPDGYLLAVERLNQADIDLNLRPCDCLVIEDTPAGIEAGKRAGMQVVGVANTYPFHFMQRLADWVVDNVSELELERILVNS